MEPQATSTRRSDNAWMRWERKKVHLVPYPTNTVEFAHGTKRDHFNIGAAAHLALALPLRFAPPRFV
jgi:hypothetical protein